MKKLIILIMMVVMALSVGGCGGNEPTVPKADYSFTAQDFVRDYFSNYYGKGAFDSVKIADKFNVKKFDKIYQNKRIEISGIIEMITKTNDNHHVVTFYVPQGEKLAIVLRVFVRDKNTLDRLKKKDFIKMSCLFDGIVENYEHKEFLVVTFDFIDGVLVTKL
ncbi:MAG: hypothetical protein MJ048_00460 [Acidaminococcaceae bacterium]|nr:hypothetical protein [Acidaminococcaceae bacterium]